MYKAVLSLTQPTHSAVSYPSSCVPYNRRGVLYELTLCALQHCNACLVFSELCRAGGLPAGGLRHLDGHREGDPGPLPLREEDPSHPARQVRGAGRLHVEGALRRAEGQARGGRGRPAADLPARPAPRGECACKTFRVLPSRPTHNDVNS